MNWLSHLFAVMILMPVLTLAQDKSSTQPQAVTFSGSKVALSGILTVPKAEAGKRVPGVLIIGAPGVMLEKTAGADYRELAEALVARGLAVLRFDTRCDCETTESFDDFVDDALGALKYLRSREGVDSTRIFVYGHGEGALIAASLAAHEEEKLSGVVLAGMPGRTLGKVRRELLLQQLKEAGKPAAEIEARLAKYDLVVKGLAEGKSDFSALKLDPKDPEEAPLLRMIDQPQVIISLLVNDPLRLVVNFKWPVLVLHTKKQAAVGAKDAGYIEEALKRSYHQDVTVSLSDDLNSSSDPALRQLVAQWVTQRSNPTGSAGAN
ncbi:MAG TPA: alpha/beta hydrolase [Blastocatellia bacterium]|nr:alpha/beta hydrolase [Blastocatellia bacterium]